MAAALPVFAERGYTQTTLDSVAKLVGLTRSGILHHFASKEALFLAVLERQRAWAQQQVDSADRSTTRGLSAFLGHAGHARVPLQLVHVLAAEAIAGNEAAAGYVAERADFVRSEIRRRLQESRERGEVDPAIDLDEATTLVAATLNGLQAAWLLDADVPTEPAFDLLLRLLGPRPTA
ncbi:TetR/AcrR family transcriptional regulator [Cryptosporangium aurantiacum]|uniref:TetR/AcrR family transcriptional regulator n=1 Tax=Cryptosporangium aurantiacum TaxID=134849 RepID=UPI0015BB8EB2|nr:TetR family transcriptional regulator [Cryptosporangium aurantiacum]